MESAVKSGEGREMRDEGLNRLVAPLSLYPLKPASFYRALLPYLADLFGRPPLLPPGHCNQSIND